MDDRSCSGEMTYLLESVRRRLHRLTVVIVLLVLVLMLTVAVVFGNLVEYFACDAMLLGGVSIGAAVLGFGLGYFAGRRV